MAKTVAESLTQNEPEESRGLLQLLPPKFSESILACQAKRPELFGMEERTLYRLLGSEGCQPTPTDNRLRIRFWLEYDRAQAAMTAMTMRNIYVGVCSHILLQDYAKRPEKMAWLLTIPASYETVAEEVLSFGYEQLRDILELPHTKPNGQIDTKLMELKLKITMLAELRVKGAVAQIQKNLNVNLNGAAKEIGEVTELRTMEDIQKKLKDLERRERKSLNSPPPINLDATD